MWLAHIFRDDVAWSIFGLLLFTNHLNASAARAGCRFKDVHIFKVTHLSVNGPSLVIFWKNVCGWSNIKSLAIQSSTTQNISPHKILSTDAPTSCKMIDPLELIDIFYTARFKQPCPQQIPVCTVRMSKACHFKCIYNTIIGMCALGDFEWKLHAWVELFLFVLHNTFQVRRQWSLFL